ncbi:MULTISPECIES: GFA family protein [unclassified Agarivorans]|uniref:GFA family protein n=1 Tax=unclassified Agarivorans TaxID=2636026 RepID=UPI0026E43ADE|nr:MULTISPECIES: GFA family protein [unclassified Agarivorans]MDO6686608.1 GFA family protein [Agarivorans sp. 3_MG-2023]MDO6715426.1 GFA family protein [Agarivorans sp. 2_MG-2023]
MSKQYQGSCHCGAVKFSLSTNLDPAVRCNCSLCQRKGIVMVTAEDDSFRLLQGEQDLTLYKWNTKVANHYFCKHCGIYTFHNPRTAPELTRVNAGCLDGIDPLALAISVVNGAGLSSE